MRSFPCVIASASLLLLACSGKAVPQDGTPGDSDGGADAQGMPGASDGTQSVPAACPLIRLASSSVAVSGQDDCKSKSLGRWALCHAERDYTGKGDLPAMWNGADGVEYADENGAWTFYYLRKQPDGSLARIPGLAYYGRVEFTTVFDGKCDVTLRAEDGKSDAYNRFQFWDAPAAYRDFVTDIYDFVRID
jgi:hypothetical protein